MQRINYELVDISKLTKLNVKNPHEKEFRNFVEVRN